MTRYGSDDNARAAWLAQGAGLPAEEEALRERERDSRWEGPPSSCGPMTARLWVLGAGDPEMERIEALLADAKACNRLRQDQVATMSEMVRGAIAKLDEAAGLGTRIWVHCWRGAAYLKLGERGKALADLDAAIEADPQDLEAYVWRGEARRLMGRNAEALRDLDRAIALDPNYAWAYVNRALARGASGDAKGMAADVAMIPDDVVAAPRGPKETRGILEKALERAKGIRRPERYLDAMWRSHG